jgi:phosphohistidine phosphatase
MKTLLLLRHGKSDWNVEFERDQDRPLAPRGVKAARLVGRFLAASSSQPQRVLTSPAVRARATADLAALAGEWECPVEVLPALYGGTPQEILEEVRRQDDGLDRILLAGHEPTWSQLCELLTGARARIPTACLACVALDCDRWVEAASARGELQWLLPPRLLKAAGL